VESVRHKTRGSTVKKSSLAAELGIVTQSQFAKSMQTNFQEKIAAELWLNIGGKDYRLIGKSVRLGRATDNDIVLDHKSVSRYHALISIHNAQVIIEDLKSRNGIRVSGARVKRSDIKDNDEIGVGDLEGVFFQRLKKNIKSGDRGIPTKKKVFNLFDKIRISEYLERFQDLEPKQKKIGLAVGMLMLFGLWLMFFHSGPSELNHPALNQAITQEAELRPSDRKSFERCLEAEDLGNFRQASACYKNLAATSEVQTAMERVTKRQSDISERRFKEGKQAFENYYYDMAILKFQEVLLVSDDSSEYRTQAFKGIQDAEGKKKQQ
jgi:pSer/pThr/pTyr-binding forkhead associated (FHA) protein